MIIQGLGEVRSLFCSLYFEEKIAAGRETTTNPGRLRKQNIQIHLFYWNSINHL